MNEALARFPLPPIDAAAGGATRTDCAICGLESCEEHARLPTTGIRYQRSTGGAGLPLDTLTDAVDVATEGRVIDDAGVPYIVDGLITNYGMAGMHIAYAKVGKTTLAYALGASVATGSDFLNRRVQRARVLAIAAEDPPEYTAWLARHLTVPRGAMTFYRRPIQFDVDGLEAIAATVRRDRYGLVLVASWQAVIAGLVRDENDNAGAVTIVERVKQAARATGIPWVIDAHSGKGEDQSDDADPTRAMRGASAAAGAADFLISLRYAGSPFSSQRRLSGKGRFVSVKPMLLDFDAASGTYEVVGESQTAVVAESTWLRIREAGVLAEWCSADAIALAIGMVTERGRVSAAGRTKVRAALRDRAGVDTQTEKRRGQTTTLYRLAGAAS
jgi:hypothetical protein